MQGTKTLETFDIFKLRDKKELICFQKIKSKKKNWMNIEVFE